MKSQISNLKILVCVAASLASSAAFATSPRAIDLGATITQVELDPALNFEASGAGMLTISRTDRQVTLALQPLHPSPVCLPGRACPRYVVSALMIELPLKSAKRDFCGIVTYVATRDSRPVDGSKETITVQDVTKNTCPTFVAYEAPTIITYETSYFSRLDGKEFNTSSKILATELSPLMRALAEPMAIEGEEALE